MIIIRIIVENGVAVFVWEIPNLCKIFHILQSTRSPE